MMNAAQNKWNALHFTAKNGVRNDILKALIDAGAYPQAADNKGKKTSDDRARHYHKTTNCFISSTIYERSTKFPNFNIIMYNI
jgi:hypothetical protein